MSASRRRRTADKAREMGIDWWANDPTLTSKSRGERASLADDRERAILKSAMKAALLERAAAQLEAPAPAGPIDESPSGAQADSSATRHR